MANNKCIKMNGRAERVELIIMWLMMPLWGLTLPWVGASTLAENPYAGLTILGGCVFCLLHFLHLRRNKFEFEESGVRMAGVDHRIVPYGNIKTVQPYSAKSKLIRVTFTTERLLPSKSKDLLVDMEFYASSEGVAQDVIAELSSRIASPAQTT